MSEKQKASNVTAWVLDPNVTVAAEGATLAGVPGIWHPDRPVSPEAFGMSVSDFAKVVSELGLPLKRVSVKESEALTSFDGLRVNHLESVDVRDGVPLSDAARANLAAGGQSTIEGTLAESARIEATSQDEAAAVIVVEPQTEGEDR